MTNAEFLSRLKYIADNPESVSLEKLTYLTSLLKCGIIESFWSGKISYEVMAKICLDDDNPTTNAKPGGDN